MQTLLITRDSIQDLVDGVNDTLAPLLSQYIRGVSLVITDPVRVSANELALWLSYDDGGSVIGTPYQFVLYDGRTMAEARGFLAAAMASNPGYFWSPAFPISLDDTRRTKRHYVGAIYNTVLANGNLNWRPVGSVPAPGPSGSGTAGVGTTTMDSVDGTVYRSVLYEFMFRKGANTYAGTIRLVNDGAGVTNAVEYGAAFAGTTDVVLTGTWSAGNMVLQATTASGGWTYQYQRLSSLG